LLGFHARRFGAGCFLTLGFLLRSGQSLGVLARGFCASGLLALRLLCRSHSCGFAALGFLTCRVGPRSFLSRVFQTLGFRPGRGQSFRIPAGGLGAHRFLSSGFLALRFLRRSHSCGLAALGFHSCSLDARRFLTGFILSLRFRLGGSQSLRFAAGGVDTRGLLSSGFLALCFLCCS
jgi:hypothetical protein